MMKRTSVVLIPVFAICLAAFPVHVRGEEPLTQSRKEEFALKASLVAGAVFGVGADVYHAFMFAEGFEEDMDPAVGPVIITATMLTQLVSATALTYGFTYAYTQLEVNKWLSVPVGILGGALAGGISTGLTYGAMFAIGIPNGAMKMNNLEWVDTWWEAFGYFFAVGSIWGALAGILGGGVAGPVLSFSLGY